MKSAYLISAIVSLLLTGNSVFSASLHVDFGSKVGSYGGETSLSGWDNISSMTAGQLVTTTSGFTLSSNIGLSTNMDTGTRRPTNTSTASSIPPVGWEGWTAASATFGLENLFALTTATQDQVITSGNVPYTLTLGGLVTGQQYTLGILAGSHGLAGTPNFSLGNASDISAQWYSYNNSASKGTSGSSVDSSSGTQMYIEWTFTATGDSVTLSTNKNGFGGDSYVPGIHALVLNSQSVPEPTVASLGILTLAGFCLRRRRK